MNSMLVAYSAFTLEIIDSSSSVKRIFHIGHLRCGVDRRISGVMTSTKEQQIPASATFESTAHLLSL